ncbi:unnamed protein product [Sphagnum tenellum]
MLNSSYVVQLILVLTLISRNEVGCQSEGNKLFLVGGFGARAEVEIVDLSETNRTCPTAADYPPPIITGSFGTFIGGKLLVCGGEDANYLIRTNECFTYEPETDEWLRADSMRVGRSDAAAVQLSPTKWWVTGGRNFVEYLKSTEIYTVGEGFSSYVDLPTSRYFHNLVKVDDTHVMLLGGQSSNTKAWMFNTEDETWTVLPDSLVSTYNTNAGVAINNQGRPEVVITSGFFTNATQIFSVDDQTWRFGQDYPAGAIFGASSIQHADTFLVIGGYYASSGYHDTIYQYDSEIEGFRVLPQRIELGRNSFAAVLAPGDFVDCS